MVKQSQLFGWSLLFGHEGHESIGVCSKQVLVECKQLNQKLARKIGKKQCFLAQNTIS